MTLQFNARTVTVPLFRVGHPRPDLARALALIEAARQVHLRPGRMIALALQVLWHLAVLVFRIAAWLLCLTGALLLWIAMLILVPIWRGDRRVAIRKGA